MPCRRWGHTAVMYEKYMYLFGGCGKNENYKLFEAVYKLDCESYEWEKITSSTIFPETRDSHSCARIGNKMYIYGGSTADSLLNEMWTF
jgi:N-acetylneuraminic acid mutarotase